MVIDFHTHIFPEKIAKPTLDFLQERCKTVPSTNGMQIGLTESSIKAEIDYSIALPVVTNPSQFQSVNQYASELNHMKMKDSHIISFAGIHPDSEDYKKELKQIKEMGFQGIKLHPDYQGVWIDDLRYEHIIDYANNLNLIVSVHAGFDPGYPDCIHCPPDRARKMIHDVHPSKLVLAHLGGFRQWDQVEEYLVGEDIYFDTAVIFPHIKETQFLRIIQNHGMDKILFATDCPWANQTEFVKEIQSMPLSETEKEMILYKNAKNLLTLP